MTAINLPKVNKDDAVGAIQEIATADDGRLFMTTHVRQRMAERSILERQIVQRVRLGLPVDIPKWNTNEDSGWEVLFERVCAGSPLRVAVKLIENDEDLVVVMTAYWRD